MSASAAQRLQRTLRAALGAIGAVILLGAGTSAPARAQDAGVITRLSKGRTVSHWAYPLAEAAVHASPSSADRTLGRLRFLTGDGQAELYETLASDRLASGGTWIEILLPGRPNGRTGWVAQGALGPEHVVHDYLLVNRGTLRATLFRGARAVFSAPVGVGKPSTITPRGHFYVLEKLITLDNPSYGPFAIGTSAYAPTLSEWPGGGVVGIHGTNEPQLIPGRPSHGCIRMRDRDITRLWHEIGLGTPIVIM